jgi:hypothetical protein
LLNTERSNSDQSLKKKIRFEAIVALEKQSLEKQMSESACLPIVCLPDEFIFLEFLPCSVIWGGKVAAFFPVSNTFS